MFGRSVHLCFSQKRRIQCFRQTDRLNAVDIANMPVQLHHRDVVQITSLVVVGVHENSFCSVGLSVNTGIRSFFSFFFEKLMH